MSSGGPSYGERAEYGETDVCYKHPDRQSFTLCQRCGRTICTDCQIVSAVGVLCKDCTKATGGVTGTKRITRSARVAGRRFSASDSPVTYSIIAISAIVFVAQLLSYYFAGNGVTNALWYVPFYSFPDGVHAIGAGVLPSYPSGVMLQTSFEPWRMLTVMFTHSVTFLPHILLNMFTLFLFGRNLEQLIGGWRSLTLYLLSGLGGSLGVMLWGYAQPGSLFTATVGASGAIFGVMAATLVALKAMRMDVRTLAVLLAINLGIGFMPGMSISWQAHLGGMVVGAITMWIVLRTRGPRLKSQQIIALSGLTLALIALSFAFFVVLPF